MKRSKLEYQLKRIKVRTPRIFWTQCWECTEYFKREPMYYWRVQNSGPSGASFRVYRCMGCCPNLATVIAKNERYFGKHESIDKGDEYDLAIEKLAAPLD